jgi:hypothetical protein
MSLQVETTGRRRIRSGSILLVGALLVGLFTSALGLVGAAPAGAAGSPTQVAFTTNPTGVAAGSAMTAPVVQLRDSGNNNVLQAGTSVSVAINTGPGAFDPSSTTTVSTNSSGQAVFSNLVFQTAGPYTLVASSPGLTSKVSSSFTVSFGPLQQVALTTVPTTVVSGASLGITATAEDVYGNKVSTLNTGSVTLTVNTGPPGGALAGTVTRTWSGGAAAFSSSLTTVGSYTLTASYTDPTAGLLTATTGSIAVTAGAAKKLGPVQGPSTTNAGNVMTPSPTFQVEDTNGNAVADSGVTVTVTSTGTLTAGSTKTATTDSNGLATFPNLTWNTGGSYTLTAAATSLTSAVTGTFTIAPGAPVNLVFTTQPGASSAGSAVPSTVVKIEDSFNNVVTTSSDSVTLTPNGPGGFDPSATSTVTAVNGVATFTNLVLDKSGSYTLSASTPDGAVGTSHAFTVSALSATQLVFTQAPTNNTAGTVQTPNVVVQAQDQFGNAATTATGTVTLSSNPTVTLTSGTRALSSGTATFSALAIQTAGTYTLTASLSGLPSVTSGSFTIAPSVPFQLAYGTQPSNIVAGQTMSPSPTVMIEDHFGNVETGDNTDTVTLTGSLAASATGTATVAGGVATFPNVTIDTVGNVTHTLVASSSITPSIRTATSASFTVSPGVPTTLAIVQPQLGGQVNTGNSIGTFYLEQYDQYGNYSWGSAGTPLTFSSSSSGGTFSLTDGGPSTTTGTFNYPPNNSNPPTNRDFFFYYGDTNVGLPTITVSSPGLTSATQQVQIIDVESPGDPTSPAGSAITPVTVTGQNSSPDNSFVSWSATGLPDGLSIDNSGTITGVPTTTGTYSVEVFGYEGTYAYGYTSFTWTIDNNVSVTDPGSQSNVSGTSITPLTIAATDSSPSATLTYADNGTLPPGLAIDPASGTITGTPTTAGTYPVVITVTDDSSSSGSTAFNWTVTNTVSATSPGDQSSPTGSPIPTLAIAASDSSSTATLSYSDGGSLPPGLSIDSGTGHITGTPTTAGTYPVVITVTDSAGYSTSVSFSWTTGSTITVTNPGNQSNPLGTAISPLTIHTSDTSHSATLTFSAGGTLPPGLSIASGTGVISGTPTTSGSYAVTVTVHDTQGSMATTAFTWTITGGPTVTAVRKTSGPSSGNARVRVTGTGFTGATKVMFGSVPATSIKVNKKGTTISARTPAEAGGVVDVTVVTPRGTSAVTAADRYTFIGAAVTGISPTNGPATGGTRVRITGAGLQGATQVLFGTVPATSYTVSSNGKAGSAIAPAHAVGTVDITVVTPQGTSAVSAADQFTFIADPAVVTSVHPVGGPVAGGTSVTINGTGFDGATSVKFGSVAATSFTVSSNGKKIVAVAPAHSAGAVDITVDAPGGDSAINSGDHYTFS